MQARLLNEIKIKPDQIKELQDETQAFKRDQSKRDAKTIQMLKDTVNRAKHDEIRALLRAAGSQ